MPLPKGTKMPPEKRAPKKHALKGRYWHSQGRELEGWITFCGKAVGELPEGVRLFDSDKRKRCKTCRRIVFKEYGVHL